MIQIHEKNIEIEIPLKIKRHFLDKILLKTIKHSLSEVEHFLDCQQVAYFGFQNLFLNDCRFI